MWAHHDDDARGSGVERCPDRKVDERTTGERAFPGSSIGEILDIPMTAHFLGGAVISSSPDRGVVDPYHRVWNYPGLHVLDGAAISANLGVNPALTITAQAERALSLWPARGGQDERPGQGQPYRVVVPHSATARTRGAD